MADKLESLDVDVFASLLGHANNQFLNFSVDPWPARGSPFLRAIELAGDEPSVRRKIALEDSTLSH
jgi:hypothetical protein